MTFKELSTKEKLEHIWEYYRLRIFVIICLFCIGISIIYAVFLRPHPDLYCGIAVYDQFISIEDTKKMISELNSTLGLDETKYTTDVQTFYTDEADVMVEAELNQKFNTYIYASLFNILLGDKEDTQTFISSEYVTPLSDYLTDEQLKEYDSSGLLLYANDPYDNQTKAMALKIDSTFLKNYNLYDGRECYLSFVPMPAEYKENTIKTFDFITK